MSRSICWPTWLGGSCSIAGRRARPTLNMVCIIILLIWLRVEFKMEITWHKIFDIRTLNSFTIKHSHEKHKISIQSTFEIQYFSRAHQTGPKRHKSCLQEDELFRSRIAWLRSAKRVSTSIETRLRFSSQQDTESRRFFSDTEWTGARGISLKKKVI